MKLFRLSLSGLCLLMLSAHGQAADGTKIHTQGGANPAAMACASCHSADAMGLPAAGLPRLAGLPAGYLAKQLADFRAGTRSNPMMQPIATALTEEEIKAVSQTLAAMPAPDYPRIPRSASAEGVGEGLALRGAWERNVPECVSCHGPGGVGVGESFPPLAGQPAQYLKGQLDAWRQGTRKNDPNNLMGPIAKALTDAEVQAVADYFAGLAPEGAAQ